MSFNLRASHYHIILTLPASAYSDNNLLAILHPDRLLNHGVALDIVYRLGYTPFLQLCEAAQHTVIPVYVN